MNTHAGFDTREIAMALPLAAFEDSALIKLVQEGQSEYFTILINRHLHAVSKCIHSMVQNAADADDVLQEVLLKVWRHLSAFRSESSFRTWMTRVAVNEVLQSYRRQQSRPLCRATIRLDALTSPAESPYQYLARIEVTKAVRTAVAGLPAIYRQVLILREFEQLSGREIAQSLHSSIPAVKTRLFRARLMLLAALQRSNLRDWVVDRRNRLEGLFEESRNAA
ncbi:MAG: polymerase, sigma-24 subunit, subfamily [Bryobacterales bacterium]|jgi:RNA polymerase sigma-70 factor (ECF subfamily)|nr:polymerase, sigma-24 subunit, subfamily [Bryobacterales bacterium]